MDIFGLPVHPLVVHAAVVLLPLAALGALVIVISAKARKAYGALVAVGAVVAAGAVVGARLSGEAFAGATTGVGALGTHMAWGLLAPWPAVALALTTTALVVAGRGKRGPVQLTLGVLTVIAALASLAVIAIVGHTGATSVWGQPA